MKLEAVFPALMIALSFLAGTVYAYKGDMPRFAYWTAASILNLSVLFMK